MDVDVLPLEGILKRVNGFHETVRDFDSFFAALKKCPGDDDKPLRVLQTKFGGRLMAKFACAGTQRTQSLQDERRNLSKLKGPHIEDMVWNGEHNDNIAILTEYIEPFGRFHTMRDLVHASDVEWRSTFFQVLFTLATLQSNFPGFRHNDLKADNVLITYGKAKSYSFQHLGMRRTFFLPLARA
jgi:serine/threonine protein kinase